jgi:hypothetical protein
MGVESREFPCPETAISGDPLVDLGKWSRFDVVDPSLGILFDRHKARFA